MANDSMELKYNVIQCSKINLGQLTMLFLVCWDQKYGYCKSISVCYCIKVNIYYGTKWNIRLRKLSTHPWALNLQKCLQSRK